MTIFGAHTFIEYDGFWHLFMDTQNTWKLFRAEYRSDAHPILYHLVLRLIAPLGHSRLLYRSASIIPGAITVYLLGQIASKLCNSKAVALLAAAAYGFSMTMLGINIDVRSYPLALLFTVAAFGCFVNFLQASPEPAPNRELLKFGIFTSLGIATEYYVIFFWIACLATLGLLVAIRVSFRESFVSWLSPNWRSATASLAIPFLVIAFFYRTHIRYQPKSYGHVSAFYWTPGTSKAEFLLRNLRLDTNYLLPLQIPSTWPLLLFLVPAISAIIYTGLLSKNSRRSLVAGVPGLLVLFLFLELAVLGLIDRYPFGGYDRQQSIYFPFFLLTGFVFLDRLLHNIRFAWIRTIFITVVAAGIAINFLLRHAESLESAPDGRTCRAGIQNLSRQDPPGSRSVH